MGALPSSSASFMEVRVTSNTLRTRATVAVAAALRTSFPNSKHRAQLDLIALALHGKKIGFEKVIKMIDDMIETLKQEQADDDSKKEYCASQFDSTDDKKKALERSVSDLGAAIASAEGAIATVKDEIAALGAGIKALDKAVAEATEQRKDENAEFKALMASDTAAKELLRFAQNRLNKFYNPKLYKPPAKAELSSEDRIFQAEGGAIPTAPPSGIAGSG